MHPAFELINDSEGVERFANLSSPCYVIEEEQIIRNCEILSSVMEHTGCKILLAQKAYAPLFLGFFKNKQITDNTNIGIPIPTYAITEK